MKMRALFLTVTILLAATVYNTVSAAKVKGNGDIVTKVIQVDAYKSINLGSGIDCSSRFFDKNSYRNPAFNYSQSSGSSSLSITMDENLFEHLDITSSNGELNIRTKRGTSINPSQLLINGKSEDLSKVSVSGCIDFLLVSDFKSDQLEISISGASDVKLNRQATIGNLKIRISGAGDLVADDLACNTIECNVSGAGDITLRGRADKGKFTVSGAGDIKAYDFPVVDLECKVSGSGDVKVNATGTLDASVSGVGDIHYKGNAKANTRVSGFGDIKKAN